MSFGFLAALIQPEVSNLRRFMVKLLDPKNDAFLKLMLVDHGAADVRSSLLSAVRGSRQKVRRIRQRFHRRLGRCYRISWHCCTGLAMPQNAGQKTESVVVRKKDQMKQGPP